MDIKISKDCYVPIENIAFYSSYASHSVLEDVKRKKEQGIVHNYTHGGKILSVVYLISGDVILSDTLPETIHKRISGTDAKQETQDHDLENGQEHTNNRKRRTNKK